MYLGNKKKGFILIEVLIIMNIIIVFLLFYYRASVNNIKKINYYNSKSDLMTLNQKEENLINDVEAYINFREEIKEKLINPYEMYDLIFTKTSSEDKNLTIEIKQGKIYIINRLYESIQYKRLRFITCSNKGVNNIMLIPTLYKSDYLKYRS